MAAEKKMEFLDDYENKEDNSEFRDEINTEYLRDIKYEMEIFNEMKELIRF